MSLNAAKHSVTTYHQVVCSFLQSQIQNHLFQIDQECTFERQSKYNKINNVCLSVSQFSSCSICSFQSVDSYGEERARNSIVGTLPMTWSYLAIDFRISSTLSMSLFQLKLFGDSELSRPAFVRPWCGARGTRMPPPPSVKLSVREPISSRSNCRETLRTNVGDRATVSATRNRSVRTKTYHLMVSNLRRPWTLETLEALQVHKIQFHSCIKNDNLVIEFFTLANTYFEKVSEISYEHCCILYQMVKENIVRKPGAYNF
uniref:SFRICE_008128 n=1 Tax=Spodoptera frugiperda TaxID=7108 RepID=A0A2H1VKF3_SPOFR